MKAIKFLFFITFITGPLFAQQDTQCLELFKICTQKSNLCKDNSDELRQLLRLGKGISFAQEACLGNCNESLVTCYEFLDQCDNKISPNLVSDVKDLTTTIKENYIKTCQWEDSRCENRKYDCRSEANRCLNAVEDVKYGKQSQRHNIEEIKERCKNSCMKSSFECKSILAMCTDRLAVPIQSEIERFRKVINDQFHNNCE